MVTTAYGPSAANNTYWPEMYTVQPMVDPRHNNPYTDTPAPKVFGNASPFDPQLFSSVNGFADELLKGERSGKYSPVEVAQWLEDLAQTAASQLAQTTPRKTPEFRRMAIDISIQAALGRFFAARFRSGVLYGIHERTGDRTALEEALKLSRAGARNLGAHGRKRARRLCQRRHCGRVALAARPLARPPAGHRRDIADMAKRAGGRRRETRLNRALKRAIDAVTAVMGRPSRGALHCTHKPATFRRAAPANYRSDRACATVSARLRYRHWNQAERFETAETGAAKVMCIAPQFRRATPIRPSRCNTTLKSGKVPSRCGSIRDSTQTTRISLTSWCGRCEAADYRRLYAQKRMRSPNSMFRGVLLWPVIWPNVVGLVRLKLGLLG